MHTLKKAVVIPCYRVSAQIRDVIRTIPAMIDFIIVVDDACPERSGKLAVEINDPRLSVLFNETNQGVGGAVICGYQKALALECDIIIKMDGDGQMDPAYLPALIGPLERGEADYAKGNRFADFKTLRSMPTTRLLANNIGSFAAKSISGYWHLMDPANGYTAITRQTLVGLPLAKMARRYFFETDMLVHLRLANAVVVDVPIPARYGNEKSSFTAREVLLHFPGKLMHRLLKRILLQYFIHDFNMGSVYVLLGLPLFLFSVIFGVIEWVNSAVTGVPRSAGTIMLSALPLIIGFEMLLQAISIDIMSTPRKRNSVLEASK